MRDTGLPARIRAKAVPVELVAGWETRGRDGGDYPDFEPIGALLHHTAGGANGTIPSLATLIYGRPDVEGPLSQVGQSREANHVDKAYVIAAGKANHGGVGSWSGPAGTMNSNYESEGLEVEHVGTGPVHPARLETAARIIAAMLEVRAGLTAAMACTHYEYALPAGRKIDFYDLDPPFNQPSKAAEFRARVAYWIGRGTTRPVDPANPFAPAEGPAATVPEDEDMELIYHFNYPGSIRRTIHGDTVLGWSSGTDLAKWEAMVEKQVKDRTGRAFQVPTLTLSSRKAFDAHTDAHRAGYVELVGLLKLATESTADLEAIRADLADEEPVLAAVEAGRTAEDEDAERAEVRAELGAGGPAPSVPA